jgi:hypothetical protein
MSYKFNTNVVEHHVRFIGTPVKKEVKYLERGGFTVDGDENCGGSFGLE